MNKWGRVTIESHFFTGLSKLEKRKVWIILLIYTFLSIHFTYSQSQDLKHADSLFGVAETLLDEGFDAKDEQKAEDKFKQAEGYYHLALTIYRERQDSLANWLHAYNFIAWRLANAEKWARLDSLMKYVMDACWKRPSRMKEYVEWCKIYTNRGLALFSKGEFLDAKNHLDSTFYIFHNRSHESNELTSILQERTNDILARCNYRLGEYQAAYISAAQLSDYYLSNNRVDAAAHARLLASSALTQLNRFREAIRYCEEALAWHSISDRNRGGLQNNMGFAYLGLNQYVDAIFFAQEAIQIYDDLLGFQDNSRKPLLSKLESLLVIALANQRMEHFEQARIHYEEALDCVQKYYGHINKPEAVRILVYMGQSSLDQGLPDQAIEKFHQALECGLLLYKGKDVYHFPDSMVFLSQNPFMAAAIAGKAHALVDLPHSQLEDQLVNALEGFHLAMDLEEYHRSSYIFRVDKFLSANRYRSYYEQALHTAYRLYELTHKEAYKQIAFEIVERSKASVLKESVLKAKGEEKSEEYEYLYRRKQQLAHTLEKAFIQYQYVDSLSVNMSSLIDSFEVLKHIQFTLLKGRHTYGSTLMEQTSSSINLVNIQRYLSREESVILEFFVTEGCIYLFIISKNEFALHKIQHTPDFQSEIIDFQQLLAKGDSISKNVGIRSYMQAFIQKARTLYQMMISPAIENQIARLSKNSARLIIIPDQFLAYLPFETLLTEDVAIEEILEKQEVLAFKQLPYLFRTFALRYAYSSSLLLDIKGENKSLFFFNSPSSASAKPYSYIGYAHNYRKDGERIISGEPTELQPILTAPIYVEKAAELMKGKAVLNEQASIRNFKKLLQDGQIIQLALHGKSDIIQDLSSWIAFAKDSLNLKHPEGLLYAREIYQLDIAANLLILSGCYTGDGKLQSGEGVMSLARAFTYAGCPSIVNTLWTANEQIAGMISLNFLTYIYEGEPKDIALQKAKLDYLEKGADVLPYYWSGFVLHGDAHSLNFRRLTIAQFWLIISFLMIGITFLIKFIYQVKDRKYL